MNHVVSKTYAIEKARQVFQEEQNEFTKLYVSVDAMKVSQIKDYFGNKIFEHLPEDISRFTAVCYFSFGCNLRTFSSVSNV